MTGGAVAAAKDCKVRARRYGRSVGRVVDVHAFTLEVSRKGRPLTRLQFEVDSDGYGAMKEVKDANAVAPLRKGGRRQTKLES